MRDNYVEINGTVINLNDIRLIVPSKNDPALYRIYFKGVDNNSYHIISIEQYAEIQHLLMQLSNSYQKI